MVGNPEVNLSCLVNYHSGEKASIVDCALGMQSLATDLAYTEVSIDHFQPQESPGIRLPGRMEGESKPD
jgi:hypothetical protein